MGEARSRGARKGLSPSKVWCFKKGARLGYFGEGAIREINGTQVLICKITAGTNH